MIASGGAETGGGAGIRMAGIKSRKSGAWRSMGATKKEGEDLLSQGRALSQEGYRGASSYCGLFKGSGPVGLRQECCPPGAGDPFTVQGGGPITI